MSSLIPLNPSKLDNVQELIHLQHKLTLIPRTHIQYNPIWLRSLRILPDTTNCPVKSILQATYTIDKLFPIYLDKGEILLLKKKIDNDIQIPNTKTKSTPETQIICKYYLLKVLTSTKTTNHLRAFIAVKAKFQLFSYTKSHFIYFTYTHAAAVDLFQLSTQ